MGSVMDRTSEVNYRGFDILEERYRMDVQVTSKSDFLAKSIFDETISKPIDGWEVLKRVILSIIGLFVRGVILYEVATR
jgi:hypothetical protein